MSGGEIENEQEDTIPRAITYSNNIFYFTSIFLSKASQNCTFLRHTNPPKLFKPKKVIQSYPSYTNQVKLCRHIQATQT